MLVIDTGHPLVDGAAEPVTCVHLRVGESIELRLGGVADGIGPARGKDSGERAGERFSGVVTG
jgi:hypothetical protein